MRGYICRRLCHWFFWGGNARFDEREKIAFGDSKFEISNILCGKIYFE